MAAIELEYSGGDLVISREIVEKTLGLHPGDRVEVRPKAAPFKVTRSPQEAEVVFEAFERFRDAFEPSDLDDWEAQRRELWATWKPERDH